MANRFEITIEGLTELNADLKKLPRRLQRNVTNKALRAGGNLMLKDARKRAPKGKTGNLRRSIFLRSSKIHNGRRGRLKGLYIGLRSFSKQKATAKGNAYYNRFVHDGYNVKGTKRDGKAKRGRSTNPGSHNIKGTQYVVKAFKRKSGKAIRLTVKALDVGTQKLLTRLGF